MPNDQDVTEFMQNRLMIGSINDGDIISFGSDPKKYRVSEVEVNVPENMITAFSFTPIPE